MIVVLWRRYWWFLFIVLFINKQHIEISPIPLLFSPFFFYFSLSTSLYYEYEYYYSSLPLSSFFWRVVLFFSSCVSHASLSHSTNNFQDSNLNFYLTPILFLNLKHKQFYCQSNYLSHLSSWSYSNHTPDITFTCAPFSTYIFIGHSIKVVHSFYCVTHLSLFKLGSISNLYLPNLFKLVIISYLTL